MGTYYKLQQTLRESTKSGTQFLRDDETWATPSGSLPSLAGNADKVLTVNDTEDGTEWLTPSGGSGLTHPQVLARTLGA